MEIVFHNLVDEFRDKIDLVDDLEEKVNTLSHIKIYGLKEKMCSLKETNT